MLEFKINKNHATLVNQMVKQLVLLSLILLAPSVMKAERYLTVDQMLDKANKNNLPAHFTFIYSKQGESHFIEMRLNSENLLPANIEIVNASGITLVNTPDLVRYSGRILKCQKSMVNLTIFNDHTEVMISSSQTGNVFISKQGTQPTQYAAENNFIEKHTNQQTCSPNLKMATTPSANSLRTADPGCKKIYLSITADYDLYLKKGSSISSVSNYIAGVINNVQAIYQLEDIQIGISQIIIHNSPDAFRHLSAQDDLNIFRFMRPSYNGDIALCMSGYTDASGFAPLGGHAFINALCNRSLSYAYINVDGAYRSYPDYSWDIFGATHELGHVIGSPHTHTCAWGPNGNETLDNCSTPEGGCSPGPPPGVGTIMSYCHLPGGPGINFAAGFGDEPGALLRQKVASAACLSEYVPSSMPSRTNTTFTANRQCNDGSFTHYYYDNHTPDESDDVLIMSINSDNQPIGNVTDGSLNIQCRFASKVTRQEAIKITAGYVPTGTDYYVTNKFWTIQSSYIPVRDVTIRLPYSSADLTELDQMTPTSLSISEVKSFIIKNPGNADPDLNHRNVTTARYSELHNDILASSTTWREVTSAGVTSAEIKTKTLHQYGLGVYALGLLPVELIEWTGKIKDGRAQLNWKTGAEINLDRFEIEKSSDGKNFNTVYTITPSVPGSKTYGWIDEAFNSSAYYRLKMIDLDGSFEYSDLIYLQSSGEDSNSPSILKNPVSDGQLSISISNTVNPITITLYSALGCQVLNAISSEKRIIDLDVSALPSGYYLLKITGDELSYQEAVIVSNH